MREAKARLQGANGGMRGGTRGGADQGLILLGMGGPVNARQLVRTIAAVRRLRVGGPKVPDCPESADPAGSENAADPCLLFRRVVLTAG